MAATEQVELGRAEAGGRLVEKHEARPDGDRPGQLHEATCAVRQRAGGLFENSPEAHRLQPPPATRRRAVRFVRIPFGDRKVDPSPEHRTRSSTAATTVVDSRLVPA